MQSYDLVHKVLESSKVQDRLSERLSDKLPVKVLTSEGEVLDITEVTFDAEANTVWLKAEIAE
jgi:hypothetical protein